VTAVDELVAFVRAALDAKEQEARAFLARSGTSLLPQRLYREQLAEVEAKRQVVEECAYALAKSAPRSTLNDFAWTVLRPLAQPYAGRPGWREEWQLSDGA
jgi:CxxC motif-containing protein (DUF1111 family)